MIEKTDVIVIGMNVAGATVSKELSSLGLDTLVVERLSQKKIGEKPDLKSKIAAQAEGRGINRYKFNQYLVKSALNEGVKLLNETIALSPVFEGHGDSKKVSGVVVSNKKEKTKELEAKIVVTS